MRGHYFCFESEYFKIIYFVFFLCIADCNSCFFLPVIISLLEFFTLKIYICCKPLRPFSVTSLLLHVLMTSSRYVHCISSSFSWLWWHCHSVAESTQLCVMLCQFWSQFSYWSRWSTRSTTLFIQIMLWIVR